MGSVVVWWFGQSILKDGGTQSKNGVIYLPTGQQDIFPLDAKTGEILWQFVSEDVDPRSDGTWASRGVALAEGCVNAAQRAASGGLKNMPTVAAR
jgi:glucose dehydrogenase